MPAALPQVTFFLLIWGVLSLETGSFEKQRKKYLFVNFACFGVVKVA